MLSVRYKPFILNVVMLSDVMLSAIMLSVVMMMNVVASTRAFVPLKSFQHIPTFADKATNSLLKVDLYKVHY
jgi:hypothetical protein